MRSENTKERIYEIAAFTRSVDDFTFTRNGQDFGKKCQLVNLKFALLCG